MQLYLFVLGGLVISLIFHFHGVQGQRWYALATATLLAVGLYSSTFGIAVSEARRHARLIISAITVGVFLKAIIIGSIMTLILHNPFGFILGIVVAQIDPLSTATLLKGSRLSARAKSILGAWASFDDPVTVIMSLYAPILVAALTGAHWKAIGGTMQEAGIGAYLAQTSFNIAFAVGIFVLWRFLRKRARTTNYVVVLLAAVAMYTLVAASLSVAVYFFWMLGVAIIGLFMRPPIESVIDRTVNWALCMAAILLGILLINGVNILPGIALGLAAFTAQIIVGALLTQKLPGRDRWHIAFAQQNGITAIILALLFEPYYPGTIAIVGPAILTINTVHAVANRALDVYLEGWTFALPSLSTWASRVKNHMNKLP